jgi:hypothetical protein
VSKRADYAANSILVSKYIYYMYCEELTINVPVVYMVRYKVVLRGEYP